MEWDGRSYWRELFGCDARSLFPDLEGFSSYRGAQQESEVDIFSRRSRTGTALKADGEIYSPDLRRSEKCGTTPALGTAQRIPRLRDFNMYARTLLGYAPPGYHRPAPREGVHPTGRAFGIEKPVASPRGRARECHILIERKRGPRTRSGADHTGQPLRHL